MPNLIGSRAPTLTEGDTWQSWSDFRGPSRGFCGPSTSFRIHLLVCVNEGDYLGPFGGNRVERYSMPLGHDWVESHSVMTEWQKRRGPMLFQPRSRVEGHLGWPSGNYLHLLFFRFLLFQALFSFGLGPTSPFELQSNFLGVSIAPCSIGRGSLAREHVALKNF